MSFYELESDGAEDGFDGLCDGIFYIVIRLQSGRWGNSSLGKEFRDTSNNPFVVAMMDDGCRGKGLLVELLLVVPDVMINEAEAGQGSVAFRSSGVAEFIIKGGEEVPRVGSEYGAIRQEVPVPCVEISEVTVKSLYLRDILLFQCRFRSLGS